MEICIYKKHFANTWRKIKHCLLGQNTMGGEVRCSIYIQKIELLLRTSSYFLQNRKKQNKKRLTYKLCRDKQWRFHRLKMMQTVDNFYDNSLDVELSCDACNLEGRKTISHSLWSWLKNLFLRNNFPKIL